MGESEPYEPDLDDYPGLCDDSPCDRCDSPCEKCQQQECDLGPDLEYRPDYQHMKDLCFEPETGLYPDLAKCQRDYYHAAKDCGYEKFCADRESNCPDWREHDDG